MEFEEKRENVRVAGYKLTFKFTNLKNNISCRKSVLGETISHCNNSFFTTWSKCIMS